MPSLIDTCIPVKSGRTESFCGLLSMALSQSAEYTERSSLFAPAKNSISASSKKSILLVSINSTSASVIEYGSDPKAPAASQNACSSGSCLDSDTRFQHVATSDPSMFLEPSRSTTVYTNLPNACSASARVSVVLASTPNRICGFLLRCTFEIASKVEPSDLNLKSGSANPLRYSSTECSLSRDPKICHQLVAIPSARWIAGTVRLSSWALSSS